MKTVKKALAAAPPPVTATPHFDFEREAFASGLRWVAGVDEVGRGPLAGPVGVAAVILDPNNLPFGVDDSKVLPEAKRQELCEIIFAKALSISIVFASVEGIDAMNIRGAAPSAMARAVAGLRPPSGPGADRRPRFARRAHLPGAPDRRQDNARRAHAQPPSRLSRLRLCRARRLCDRWSPSGAGAFRPCPYLRRSFRSGRKKKSDRLSKKVSKVLSLDIL